jgi:hypothetical protein
MLGVTALRAVAGGAAGRIVDGFEVAWLTEDGDQHRSTLSGVWATPFEWCLPARLVGVASQPFWLFRPAGEGKVRSHVPAGGIDSATRVPPPCCRADRTPQLRVRPHDTK